MKSGTPSLTGPLGRHGRAIGLGGRVERGGPGGGAAGDVQGGAEVQAGEVSFVHLRQRVFFAPGCVFDAVHFHMSN